MFFVCLFSVSCFLVCFLCVHHFSMFAFEISLQVALYVVLCLCGMAFRKMPLNCFWCFFNQKKHRKWWVFRCLCCLRSTRRLDYFGNSFQKMFHILRHAWFDSGYMFWCCVTCLWRVDQLLNRSKGGNAGQCHMISLPLLRVAEHCTWRVVQPLSRASLDASSTRLSRIICHSPSGC